MWYWKCTLLLLTYIDSWLIPYAINYFLGHSQVEGGRKDRLREWIPLLSFTQSKGRNEFKIKQIWVISTTESSKFFRSVVSQRWDGFKFMRTKKGSDLFVIHIFRLFTNATFLAHWCQNKWKRAFSILSIELSFSSYFFICINK